MKVKTVRIEKEESILNDLEEFNDSQLIRAGIRLLEEKSKEEILELILQEHFDEEIINTDLIEPEMVQSGRINSGEKKALKKLMEQG